MTLAFAIQRDEGLQALRSAVYIFSGRFDYDRWPVLHGPRYGRALGLETRAWSVRGALPTDEVLIVDQRVLAEDVAEIEAFALRHPEQRFVLRVVDPYWPPQDCNPLRDLAFRLVGRVNTAVLLAYQPVEVTQLLLMAYGPDRIHVSPYPYLRSLEFPLDQPRKRRAIISGNATASVYPLRALARHKRRRSLVWRRFSEDLSHPGYLAGQRSPKALLGTAYLQHLASFEAMFLCPSRAGLEFFKYGECAYAGCAPVGEAPQGFPSAAVDCIVPFDSADMHQSIRRIVRTPVAEWRERAAAYRTAMAADRDPAVLRQHLDAWLQCVWPVRRSR
jgi:hypothetical protein